MFIVPPVKLNKPAVILNPGVNIPADTVNVLVDPRTNALPNTSVPAADFVIGKSNVTLLLVIV